MRYTRQEYPNIGIVVADASHIVSCATPELASQVHLNLHDRIRLGSDSEIMKAGNSLSIVRNIPVYRIKGYNESLSLLGVLFGLPITRVHCLLNVP